MWSKPSLRLTVTNWRELCPSWDAGLELVSWRKRGLARHGAHMLSPLEFPEALSMAPWPGGSTFCIQEGLGSVVVEGLHKTTRRSGAGWQRALSDSHWVKCPMPCHSLSLPFQILLIIFVHRYITSPRKSYGNILRAQTDLSESNRWVLEVHFPLLIYPLPREFVPDSPSLK